MFNLFRKKPEPQPLFVHTDIHNHLLPGLDDGAETLDDTLEMATALYEMGYRRMVVTPHVMLDMYRTFAPTVQERCRETNAFLQSKGVNLPLFPGAEYYLDELFLELIEKKELLCFGQHNTVLFELNYMQEPAQLQDTIFRMKVNGYTPLLAHPERYPYLFENKRIGPLKEAGLQFQVNLPSLAGHLGKGPAKHIKILLEHDAINYVGTDCHRMTHLERIKSGLAHPLAKELAALNLLNDNLVL